MSTVESTISRARRVIVITIIVSFSIAALAGIVVLLGGSGDILGRVVGTTAAVGAASIVALCGSTLFGKRGFPLGVATLVLALIALGFTLAVVWSWVSWSWAGDTFWDLWTTASVLAGAGAILSLLFPLMLRVRPVVYIVARVTGAFVMLAAVGLLMPVWVGDDFGEAYWRTVAVVGIIAVLGVVVSPVLGMLQPDVDQRAISTTRVSAELIGRIEESAAARGITVEQLLAPVLAPRPHSAHPQTQPIAPRPPRG